MPRLSFYPVGGDSYLLVAVAAVVLLALLLVGPGRQRLSRGRRLVLAGIRVLVILLMLVALVRPTLVYTKTTKQSATVVVLADKSRSMSVPDEVNGRTRWDALQHTLQDAQPALKSLAQDYEIKAYTFDAETHPVQVADGQIQLGEKPDGQQTAIGSALEDVLRQEAGKRLLGVLLLSDGAQRARSPRDVLPQTAAAQMKNLGPLYTFRFGKSRGLGQAKDVAVKELLADPRVFIKNQLTVTGQIRVDGYVNREIPVRLLFETSPGKMEPVAEKKVKVTADGQLLPVEFTYTPQAAGEFKLTLEGVEQPGELVTTNNRLSTYVNVLEGGLNVLYLEGALRVEERFLRRSLDASPDIHVDYVRLDPRRPDARPRDLASRFRPGKYAVYLLGDLDSTAFRDNELAELAKAVSAGAGLIMLGGFQSFGPGGYGETPLADVLPITMDRFERQKIDEPVREKLHWPGPLKIQPTQIGLSHFSLMLAATPRENQALWTKLPPLDGANRFSETKPGAVVLADAGRNKPLLVAQSYGTGRVMAFAADSTWHWWMRGFESAHKRFWRQMVLWLARKDESMQGNVYVRLDQRRFSPGQRVEFSVGAQTSMGERIPNATFKAEIVLPDGTERPLRLSQGEEATGTFRDTQAAGDYTIRVTATKGNEVLGSNRARFLVYEQDLELDNASADATVLDSLAAMTGGQALAPEELSALLQRLAAQTQSLEVQTETKKTLWDTWPFLLAFVGLLAGEWYLRKRWGLV
jgi:hypothetical protein